MQRAGHKFFSSNVGAPPPQLSPEWGRSVHFSVTASDTGTMWVLGFGSWGGGGGCPCGPLLGGAGLRRGAWGVSGRSSLRPALPGCLSHVHDPAPQGRACAQCRESPRGLGPTSPEYSGEADCVLELGEGVLVGLMGRLKGFPFACHCTSHASCTRRGSLSPPPS